jgi:cytoplasmic iron level regulating protein YaaA (DUF328/UPF0246 family)
LHYWCTWQEKTYPGEGGKSTEETQNQEETVSKLVDNVIKANTELIAELTEQPEIEAAWYFNGSVFAKIKD